jgi:hypothetical protein
MSDFEKDIFAKGGKAKRGNDVFIPTHSGHLFPSIWTIGPTQTPVLQRIFRGFSKK